MSSSYIHGLLCLHKFLCDYRCANAIRSCEHAVSGAMSAVNREISQEMVHFHNEYTVGILNWQVQQAHLVIQWANFSISQRMQSICGASAMSGRGKAGYVCALCGDACTLAWSVMTHNKDLALTLLVRARCTCPNYIPFHTYRNVLL